MSLLFVTSNDVKFNLASRVLASFDIELSRDNTFDFVELQALDGETIARDKAEQAYKALERPVIINDDTWNIPGLGGFPGPYMKPTTEWFTTDDWLRLTRDLKDRRIILQQHNVYQDENGQHYFSMDIVAELLAEPRGPYVRFSHELILSYDNGKTSLAENIAANRPALPSGTKTAFHLFGEWYSKQ